VKLLGQRSATFSMAAFKCIGCRGEFGDQRGLNAHKRHCKTKIRAAAAELLQLHRKKVAEKQRRSPAEGSELIHDGGDDGPSGYQQEEMAVDDVDQVGLLKTCLDLWKINLST
jgi:hypothetical protein